MAKYTLLDIINSYMDATDGFRVSTIDDVVESQQLADIAETIFYEVTNDVFNNPQSTAIIELEALADSTKPNYLKIPSGVQNIHESKIRYNVTNGEAGNSTLHWRTMQYMHPQDFLDYVGTRSTLETNSQIVTDFSGIDFVIYNKRAPRVCTSFDQEYLVFDAFDSDVDSTLQQSKSAAVVTKQRTWTGVGTDEIDLPEWFHPTYMSLVKARASEYLRGEPLVTDIQKGRAGLIKARQKMRVGNKKFQKKRYGR